MTNEEPRNPYANIRADIVADNELAYGALKACERELDSFLQACEKDEIEGSFLGMQEALTLTKIVLKRIERYR